MALTAKKRKQCDRAILAEMAALLDADGIVHEAAREGSRHLAVLGDADKLALFHAIREKESTDSILSGVLPKSLVERVDRQQLVAALRRLGISLLPFLAKYKEMASATTRKRKERRSKALTLGFAPDMTLAEHIRSSDVAPKDMDCLTKMAGLASLLEAQLKSLYMYPTRQAQPFMGVKQVNMVAQSYMGALERLHKMQMDVGLVERAPERMEINMRQAGVFQTYIGDLSSGHKQAMIDFADSFVSFAEEKAKARELGQS